MKPYGRSTKIKKNLVDNHPQKGYINWWEDEYNSISKGRARQQAKKEMQEDVCDEIEIADIYRKGKLAMIALEKMKQMPR